MTIKNKIKDFSIFLIVLFLIFNIFYVHAQEAGNQIIAKAPSFRISNSESINKHSFVVLSNQGLNQALLEEVLKGVGGYRTLFLICTNEGTYDNFYCSSASLTATSDNEGIVELTSVSEENFKILSTRIIGKDIIVVPENFILNSDSNKAIYDYLKTYEEKYESSINYTPAEETPIINELFSLFIVTSLICVFLLVVFYLPKYSENVSLKTIFLNVKSNLVKSRTLQLNVYVSVIGIGITVIGLLLISIKDRGILDFNYVYVWVKNTLQGLSHIESTLILVALFIYFSFTLNVLFLILDVIVSFKNGTLKDFKDIAKKIKVKFIIPIIIISQVVVFISSSQNTIQLISIFNMLILLMLVWYKKDKKGLYYKLPSMWKVVSLLLIVTYIVSLSALYLGYIGKKQPLIGLSLRENERKLLLPSNVRLSGVSLQQTVKVNAPIFIKDLLIYHPKYSKIVYKEISRTELEKNTVFIESSERRLVKAIITSHNISELEQENPSTYFTVDKFLINEGLELQIKCTDNVEPSQLKLNYQSDIRSEDQKVIFFPGCYKENITVSISPTMREQMVPGYTYKIEGIPSKQISYIKLGEEPVTYLVFDRVTEREKFSYFIPHELTGGDVLTVGTDEGSYLKRDLYEIINASKNKTGVSLVPILTYLEKEGAIEKGSDVKIDSLYNGAYLEVLE